MRILKYILLLMLLIAIGLSVYVATQKGDFSITTTRIIKTPRTSVFEYVNDFHNWESWMSWREDGMKIDYSGLGAGSGSGFSWDGSSYDGSVKTLYSVENDSLYQEIDWNGNPGTASWKFSPTPEGTKITWTVSGKMGFLPKIYATMEGGAQAVMGVFFENSLARLDKVLERELNTYKVTVDGVVLRPGSPYLYQSITSTLSNMPKNMRIMKGRLMHFFEKNKITTNGKPFVLYKSYDAKKGIAQFSVCVPVRDTIHTAPGSDILSGSVPSMHALKTTLKGDHSHLRKAWDKSFDHIRSNRLTRVEKQPVIEVYVKSNPEEKNHAQWVTEIYVPIVEQAVAPAVQASAPPAKPAARASVPVTDDEEDISIP